MDTESESISLVKLFKLYIRNTPEKQLVAEKSVFIGNLTTAVKKGVGVSSSKIHVNTKVIYQS